MPLGSTASLPLAAIVDSNPIPPPIAVPYTAPLPTLPPAAGAKAVPRAAPAAAPPAPLKKVLPTLPLMNRLLLGLIRLLLLSWQI